MNKNFLFLLLTLCNSVFGQQIEGTLIDSISKEPIVQAEIKLSSGKSTFSGMQGEFTLPCDSFPVVITVYSDEYESFTRTIFKAGNYTFSLTKIKSNDLDNIVVTASRRGQKLEDVPISMDVIKPELYNNKGITSIEKALDQSPGVYSMNGQLSIRGGSGFAYGAGSRVLLLWNDMPMLSADAGDAKWNTVPIELSSKIEVIKGASSVLYGSGALNGIIAVSEIIPTEKPYYRAKAQFGIYDKPQRASLRRKQTLTYQQFEFAHGYKKKNFFYNVALSLYNDAGYREGEIEQRARITGSFGYNFAKVRGLQIGLGYSVHLQHLGSFLVWENDTLAYTPKGGADITVPGSSLSVINGLRILVDPYLKYVGKNNVKHHLKARIYSVNNQSLSNSAQNSLGNTYYTDYLFQKGFRNDFNLSAGATFTRTEVLSRLYGNHHSNNLAAYTQLDKKWGKFTLTAGVRFEYFQQDTLPIDSYLYLSKDSARKIPVYPIFRAALTYKPVPSTILRASFGQGVRYPATSERFVMVSIGSLNIFPNPNLKREEGFAGEIGIKQVFKVKNWKGILDLSGFINQYRNMSEFTFGVWNPKNIALSIDPNSEGFILKWLGFRAENAEKARILGTELTFASEGNIGDVTIRSLLGYTYLQPISLNSDSSYLSNFSDTTTNMLKYRFNHLAKADVEVEYKHFSLGFSLRYNSFMKNIDRIFEDGLLGIQILEGLKQYRQLHHKGYAVVDVRSGYQINEHFRVGLMVNNVFNTEYMGRPGDVQAPRSFIAQLQLKF